MGNGSFRITRHTIDLLVSQQDFSAAHMAAYLVLARFTDESGVYTTAGASALQRYIGLSWKRANAVLEDLLWVRQYTDHSQKKPMTREWRYVWPITNYCEAHSTEPGLPRLTYALPVFAGDGEWVWFSNELVDGYGAFQNPLKALVKYGNTAVRLLLLMYKYNAMDTFGGIDPYRAHQEFKGQELSSCVPGFDFYHFEFQHSSVRIAKECLRLTAWPTGKNKKENEELEQKAIAPFWQALKGLETCGLIYPVVTVFNADPSVNRNPDLLYVLHAKTNSGYTPKGEEGLASDTARIANDINKRPVCDSQGRFYGRYAVIVPAGMPAHVCGVYRLRFRVSNPANAGVKDTWRMISDANNQAKAWINKIEGKTPAALPTDPTQDGNAYGEATLQ